MVKISGPISISIQFDLNFWRKVNKLCKEVQQFGRLLLCCEFDWCLLHRLSPNCRVNPVTYILMLCESVSKFSLTDVLLIWGENHFTEVQSKSMIKELTISGGSYRGSPRKARTSRNWASPSSLSPMYIASDNFWIWNGTTGTNCKRTSEWQVFESWKKWPRPYLRLLLHKISDPPSESSMHCL